jgi:AraC-like DNA-binding protein
MRVVKSSKARPELRPFVRAYAQRVCGPEDAGLVEFVPAQLEQILNFELGAMPKIMHRDRQVSEVASVGGAQTSYSGQLHLHAHVESFAIFFQPSGWSSLFGVPVREITNRFVDATAFAGSEMRALWNRLGEARLFESRVAIAEEFLLSRGLRMSTRNDMAATANYILHRGGRLRMSALAGMHSVGVRQLARKFEREVGTSPKAFARIARFQCAVDSKLARPERTWLEIAHHLGYHDQMHMIHEFAVLGLMTPTNLIDRIGDVRPAALVNPPEPSRRTPSVLSVPYA